jgi:photosystem II stability/assembly factor-like uncharacterized protein
MLLRQESSGAWRDESFPPDTEGELRAIDVQSSGVGVVGGIRGDADGIRPFVLATTDAGERWSVRQLPDSDTSGILTSVAVCDSTAWAAVNYAGAPGVRLFVSRDGGERWESYQTEFDATTHIRALARDTASVDE